MRGKWPICFDISDISPENNIEVKNKFEMLMAGQEEMKPDELATQARDILISSAHRLLPRKGHKQHSNWLKKEGNWGKGRLE